MRTQPGSASGATSELPKLSASVILVGHNEEDAVTACVRSLREQSFTDFDIVIVSDGSTDRMGKVASELVLEGAASTVISTDLRGGKSSGLNLACVSTRGDIIINVDCDCSFDRFAIENMIRPFADPRVGVVCADIAPRNAGASLIAQFQEIEYLQSISVGKRVSAALDQIVCASGAFAAFRRTAIEEVGGFDAGGGEDLDITMRMRSAGWRIAFQPEALCYTDVPTTMYQLVRQRLRWERDTIWIKYRKHRWQLDPGNPRFRWTEAFHQWDFLVFNVAGAAVFPAYLIWLAMNFGSFTPAILVGMQTGLLCLDTIMLALARWTTGRRIFWRNLVYLPGYSIFVTYVMRLARLVAYIDEWFLSGSRRDNFSPLKVRVLRPW